MTAVSERTKTQALAALDGMREIVRREMLVTGTYVEDEVSNPRLAGAICGGRKHCAIGSLWVGAGVKAKKDDDGDVFLPGVMTNERPGFLAERPGLRLAYDSLNAAAEDYAAASGGRFDLRAYYPAAIEDLFEGNYNSGELTKRDLLKVIASAKRRVKAAA